MDYFSGLDGKAVEDGPGGDIEDHAEDAREEDQDRMHLRGAAPNLGHQIKIFTEMISPPTTPTARLENRLRKREIPTLPPIK